MNAAPLGSRLYILNWYGSYAGKIGNERGRPPVSFRSLSRAFRRVKKCGKVCRKAHPQRFSLRPFRRRSLPSERLPYYMGGNLEKEGEDGVLFLRSEPGRLRFPPSSKRVLIRCRPPSAAVPPLPLLPKNFFLRPVFFLSGRYTVCK